MINFSNKAYLQKISSYYDVRNSKKHKHFYWDLCDLYRLEKIPKGVVFEKIYHVFKNGKDSLLEQEIFYSENNKPLKEITYGVVSKQEIISIDSLIYTNNLLEKEIIFEQGYYEKTIDTITKNYTYDSLNREILIAIKNHFGRLDTLSKTYDTYNNIVKLELGYSSKHGGWQENYFYSNSSRLDSIRFYVDYNYYTHSTFFQYDSVNNIEKSFWISKNKPKLIKEIHFNKDGSISSIFLEKIYYGYNWNKKYHNDLLIEMKTVNSNLFECAYFINGKKRYTKKHYYFYNTTMQ